MTELQKEMRKLRTKHLNLLKVIDCVINKGPCKKEVICEYFNMRKIENGKYDNKESPFGYRTLLRYLDELVKEEIFCVENKRYSIAAQYISESELDKINLKDSICTLLECGEIAVSRQLQEYMTSESNGNGLENMVGKYLRTIREPVKILKDDAEMIARINKAIAEELEITVEYKGKNYSVVPVCYVINKNASQTYLYGTKRKKLVSPFILEEVHLLDVGHVSKEINKEHYKEIIEEAWNIDVEEPKYVKVRVKPDREDTEVVNRQLKKHLEYKGKIDGIDDVYEGRIRGINDFKVWIREHMTTCIVLEPENLRKEICEALLEKKRRYEVQE